MRIFLTGATGYIGAAVLDALVRGGQARGEPARGGGDLRVGERAAAEAVVVHEEVAVSAGEVVEEVDERVADHR